MKPSNFRFSVDREVGAADAHHKARINYDRASKLRYAESRVIETVHTAGVTWMDLDQVEGRFLLSGSMDASIAVVDSLVPSKDNTHTPLVSIKKNVTHGSHKYGVTSVGWYPVDTGMFVSGSLDTNYDNVLVWDTNRVSAVCRFRLPARVYGVHMSPLATSHCLIATASADSQVQLCDPNSGTCSHTLIGHKGEVWVSRWSASSEFELATGGTDGQFRIWDIRTSRCVSCLDQTCGEPSSDSTKAQKEGSTGNKKRTRRGFLDDDTVQAASRRPDLRTNEALLTAHDGKITDICATPNSLYWISAGTDNHVRLWDAAGRYNRFVVYRNAFNSALRARQIAVDPDSRVLYYPSGGTIMVYEVTTGVELARLHGAHTETVNCCVVQPTTGDLFSGSNDASVRVWSPRNGDSEEEEDGPLETAAIPEGNNMDRLFG